MKLLLLYPLEESLIDTAMPKILEEGLGFSPPLGLLYLAASVKQHTNWEVKVIDCLAEKLTYREVRERIDRERPDAIGVTVMTHQLMDCLQIAGIAKGVDPKIKVIFGGPHVHMYPGETVAFDAVDFAIIGEAEISLVNFLNSWDRPDRFSGIPGVFFKDRGGIRSGPAPELIDDLDGLPHPDRRLSKYDLYTSPLAKEKTMTTMITSRGCPFKCIFCNRSNMGKRFRPRSAHDVVNEMQECMELGIRHVKVYDDTFTIDKKRVHAICNEIINRRLKISWDIRAHINTIDPDLLKALKKSNCKLICYGIESGNNEVLKRLRKGITRERATEVFGLTRKAGIQTLAYFMLGCPGETRDQMLETINFAKKINPDFCHFSILIPFPHTPIYTEGLEKGKYPCDYWLKFARKPTVDFKPKFWVENVPEEEMRALLVKAYREFYLRPSYIIKKIFEVRSFNELGRKVKSGLYLIRDK
jgi:radical SAM superfamily enzyme YgiQ (UPF0313 family)